ncbi:MAG: thioredoxin [Sphingobacteriia bacterium]|nr:thioredoxin [Sphingobacteriia bacterium]
MNMKNLLTLIFILCILAVTNAQEINKVITGPDSEKEMLIGPCNRQGFEHAAFKSWFDKEYQDYIPDDLTIKELRKRKKDVQITVVIGTWCSDTRRNLPRFFKVLDAIKFDQNNLKLLAVDRKKSAGEVNISGLGISLIPTFIISKNESEIGRIVENPTLSIEKDMLLILMTGD